MVVSRTHGGRNLLLQTLLMLITIIDKHRITLIGIIIRLRIARVGVADLRAQNNLVHRVNLILHLQAHLCVPRASDFVGRVLVNIGCLLAITLFLWLRSRIVYRMIDGRIATQKKLCLIIFLLQLSCQINIGVHTQVLRGGDTCILSAEPSASAAWANLIGIVGTSHNGRLAFAEEQIGEDIGIVACIILNEVLHTRSIRITISRIAIVKPTTIIRHHICAQCTRVVAKYTFLAVFLQTEIDDSLCFIVLKPSQFSHFAFLINDLYLLNHVGRDILGSSLHIVAKEFLAVNTHAFDFLAIDSHITLFIHLHAVHLLEQFLHSSSFANLIGSGIILNSITLNSHFGCPTLHTYFCKLLHLLYESNCREI